MVQTLIGKEKFRTGMDLYFARHDGEAATVEQFIQCFADASGRDMTQFMRWYSQAGTPEVTVAGRFDTARKTFILECSQVVPATPGQPSKAPMVIPLSIGLVGKDGRDLALKVADGRPLEGRTIVLTEQTARFEFAGIGERPVLSINRGFSAPINLVTDLGTDDLAFLAAHDSDPFNRWQALQTISMRLLLDNVAATRAGRPLRKDDRLAKALVAVLEDSTLEPAFAALALILPSEGDIAREIGKDIDPDAIFQARTALRVELGERLGVRLAAVYERMTGGDRYSPDAGSAGRRALRNAVLDLLAANGAAAAIARAAEQYRNADNMTDRMAALATLSLHDVPQRENALADFYNRYCGRCTGGRQVVLTASDDPASGHAQPRPHPHHPPCFLACQSQPGSLAHRSLRARQYHAVQPPRWGRLRIHRGHRACSRPEKSAGFGTSRNRVP